MHKRWEAGGMGKSIHIHHLHARNIKRTKVQRHEINRKQGTNTFSLNELETRGRLYMAWSRWLIEMNTVSVIYLCTHWELCHPSLDVRIPVIVQEVTDEQV